MKRCRVRKTERVQKRADNEIAREGERECGEECECVCVCLM